MIGNITRNTTGNYH